MLPFVSSSIYFVMLVIIFLKSTLFSERHKGIGSGREWKWGETEKRREKGMYNHGPLYEKII